MSQTPGDPALHFFITRSVARVMGLDLRQAMRSGQLPPDAVFAHGGFLHPVVGLRPPSGRWLVHYAADLVRTPDGQLLVARDRADPQQAALVKAWLTYIAGEEGQRAAQGSAGNAPLSSRARQNAQRAIDAIG